ncbi:MAG: 2Fe-2S iron-sulfur cluster-binding protein [Tepidisphaeraceae bacterium]
MPKFTMDGKEIEFTNQRSILQAALDAGVEVPHYCYHPGLSAPASCRICLVEVEGMPKLVPSCYTPPKDGMVVHCNKSTKAVANQKQVMEYLLINHPLDCPVCDKAGECLLQDYSYGYGRSESRFEEDKIKNPKKNVGEHVLLYTDRCIMCTRCVRFTREVAGTAELMVDGRGHKEEIDIFPGKPLNNKISLNVVDLCPVGALLDKSFLFQQRVWFLKRTASISPVDAGGENIWIDHNENVIHRIKPRYNAGVNQWWISNDTRHAYKVLTDERRIVRPKSKDFGALAETSWKDAVAQADGILRKAGAGLFAVLSPMMPSEEAHLLGKYIRSIDPGALLVLGPVPTTADDVFNNMNTKKETFRIQGEKVPNRRGVEKVIASLGGPNTTWDEFNRSASTSLRAGWIVGGYLSTWINEVPTFLKNVQIVVQDVLPNALTHRADVLLPGAMWAEKDGTFVNFQDKAQSFAKAVDPVVGAKRDADVYLKLLDREVGTDATVIRSEMGEPFASVAAPPVPESVSEPTMEFAEL